MRGFILLVTAVMIAALPSAARDKHDHDGEHKFRHEDVREMRHYYHGRPDGVPPGLAKKPYGMPPGQAKKYADFPPGWEHRLHRNRPLPPEYHHWIEPMPVEMEHRMPRLRPGLRRGMLGGHAVIYDERSMTLVDFKLVISR